MDVEENHEYSASSGDVESSEESDESDDASDGANYADSNAESEEPTVMTDLDLQEVSNNSISRESEHNRYNIYCDQCSVIAYLLRDESVYVF